MNHAGAMAALQQYQQVKVHAGVESVSPHRLIQMLLEGALDKISVARSHMQRGDFGAKAKHITWALSIIDGLRMSLDKNAGEIAQNLEDLYDYMGRRLVEANIANDPAILDEVSSLLREIKLGWDQIPATVQQQHNPQSL